MSNEETSNISLKNILERRSEKFQDEKFYNDLLSHDNSYTTLHLRLPAGNTIKCSISIAYYWTTTDILNRIFTISTTSATVNPESQSYVHIEKNIHSRDHQQKIFETTESLIETNVELRKEIRDHQRTLHALKVSESRFRNLTETTSDFIWEIDQKGKYTYASPKSLQILGYAPEELVDSICPLFQDGKNASRLLKHR